MMEHPSGLYPTVNEIERIKEMERLLMCRPVCQSHEHCLCQTTLDYIPHEQCCQCGQKRLKQSGALMATPVYLWDLKPTNAFPEEA